MAAQSIAWRFYVTSFRPKPVPLPFIVRAEVRVFSIAAALTPGIVHTVRRFPLGGRTPAISFSAHLLACGLFALTVKGLWDLGILPFYHTPWIAHFSWPAFGISIFAGFQVNALLYWVVAIGVTAIDHARGSRRIAMEAAKLRAQLAEAQLRSLRTQLDPHFLFNTLHTISELVHADPDAADIMIANLSELLRRSLSRRERHEIPLSEEIEFLKIYLDIQCRRFPDRLAVRYDIGGDTAGAMIPGMLLQPLVENAIRHAIAPRLSGGEVRIYAGRRNAELLLEVEDFGGSPAGSPIVEGVGLRNTRERLDTMYAGLHRLELRPGREGLCVRVSLVP